MPFPVANQLAFITWATAEEAQILTLLVGTLAVVFVWKILHTFSRDHSIVRVVGVVAVGAIALLAAGNPQWFVGQAQKELNNGGLGPIHARMAPAPVALAAQSRAQVR
jgi:hypothetical protein